MNPLEKIQREGITPTESFRRSLERQRDKSPAPLPTGFRETYSLSLPGEVVVRLRLLNKRINVSRWLEIPIAKLVAKKSRELNKNGAPRRGLPIRHA